MAEEFPRGQLSTIILMCLTETDKYGYEIIDEVLKKTNGKLSIKQPSLYSSLKRMEEQSLISSYWRDSEIGGRRHYYHLTDLGKKHLEKWQTNIVLPTQSKPEETSQDTTKVLHQENLFSFAKSSGEPSKEEQPIIQPTPFVQYDLFSNNQTITPPAINVQENQSEILENQISLSNSKQEQPLASSAKEEEEKYTIKEFEFVKKGNKSFTDKIKTTNTLTEKKYEQKDAKPNMNENNEACANLDNFTGLTESVLNKNTTTHEHKNEEVLSNINDTQSSIISEVNKTINQQLTNKESIDFNNNLSMQESNAHALNEHPSIINKVDISSLDGYVNSASNTNVLNSVEINSTIACQKEETFNESQKDQLVANSNELFNSVENKQRYTDNNNLVHDDGVFITTPHKILEKNIEDATDKHTDLAVPVKDDGVLITDRIDIKDIPKQPKFEARRFEVYISDNSLSPKQSTTGTENFEDRVKELYEKSKSNAENQELELIDSKIKFSSYEDLKSFYKEQNIKFKPYQKTLYKSDKNFDMIKINKLNMLTYLFMFISISAISLLFSIPYMFAKNVKLNTPTTYIIAPLITFLVFVFHFITYKKSPEKRIAYDTNKFKFNTQALILSLFIIPIIFAINLIFGFSFDKFHEYSLTILYPLTFVFTYVIFYVVQRILSKSKSVY